jgi:hypothetical protein
MNRGASLSLFLSLSLRYAEPCLERAPPPELRPPLPPRLTTGATISVRVGTFAGAFGTIVADDHGAMPYLVEFKDHEGAEVAGLDQWLREREVTRGWGLGDQVQVRRGRALSCRMGCVLL